MYSCSETPTRAGYTGKLTARVWLRVANSQPVRLLRSTTWKNVTLAELEWTSAVHYADLTGNGFNDGMLALKRYMHRVDLITYSDNIRPAWVGY